MNTQTATRNDSDNNDATELDGATHKHWLREMRLDNVLGIGNRRARKTRGSRRPHNMTSNVVRSNTGFIGGNASSTLVSSRRSEQMSGDFEPYIPEGCKPEDVIPGTGGWTWGEALEASLEARSRRSRR